MVLLDKLWRCDGDRLGMLGGDGLRRPRAPAPSTVRYTALAPDRFRGFWRD